MKNLMKVYRRDSSWPFSGITKASMAKERSLKSTKLIKVVYKVEVAAGEYTQSPFIRTTSIRLDAEILGKFKTRALGSSNLRTTSKNLRTTRAQIFKAKNGKK